MPVKVLLADDHLMFCEMLRNVLYVKRSSYLIMAEAANGTDALNFVKSYQPDLLVMDYKMPGVGRLSRFCKEVLRQCSTTKILVLSGYKDEEIAREAALGGAKGYVCKGTAIDDLLTAIDTVLAGGAWADPNLPTEAIHAFLEQQGRKTDKLQSLSRQELRVLSLVARGLSNTEIGRSLHISRRTVRNHVTHILAKLRVSDRRKAMLYFFPEKRQ